MKKIHGILIMSLVMSSNSVFGYSECARPVKYVWNNMSSAASVWVTFSDGGGAIYKSEADVTAGQMSRFVSFALTAQTTGKKLLVRYPEDNMVCPPTTQSRNDFLGVWILNQ